MHSEEKTVPRSAECSGDRGAETGAAFQARDDKTTPGRNVGGGKVSRRAQNSSCAGEGGARAQAR